MLNVESRHICIVVLNFVHDCNYSYNYFSKKIITIVCFVKVITTITIFGFM